MKTIAGIEILDTSKVLGVDVTEYTFLPVKNGNVVASWGQKGPDMDGNHFAIKGQAVFTLEQLDQLRQLLDYIIESHGGIK